jgi:hypothetical protein
MQDSKKYNITKNAIVGNIKLQQLEVGDKNEHTKKETISFDNSITIYQ